MILGSAVFTKWDWIVLVGYFVGIVFFIITSSLMYRLGVKRYSGFGG